MISTQELNRIKKIKGEVRGTTFKNDFACVKKEGGKKQLEAVKKRLRELGCKEKDIIQDNTKVFSWYPLWCHVLFFVILNKELGWTEKDIFNIGYHGSRVSLIAKTFPKLMFDLKKAFNKSGIYWKKNFSVGKLELEELDLKNNYGILNLKDFNVHPLECYTIKGYLVGVLDLLGQIKDVKVKETKCVHRGDDHHQFKLTWK